MVRPIVKGDVVDDRYVLVDRLGAGSFGEVWSARRVAVPDGPCDIAVKLIRLTGSADVGSASARRIATGWHGEVQALLRVDAGETTPRFHDVNVWHEYGYIAMERLEGTTLAQRIAAGPIPWRRALSIAAHIARALDAAHAAGVVHRDLKPQNVILAGARRAAVIDWGIASLANGPVTRPSVEPVAKEAQDVGDTDTSGLEPVAGRVARRAVGTPGYMAPETYDDGPPIPAIDAFALGVVLYEMLTGELPHNVVKPEELKRPGSKPETVRAYRAQLDAATQDLSVVPFVSLSERAPNVPRGVVTVVDALLMGEPDRRPTKLSDAIDYANRFPNGVPSQPYTGLVALGIDHAGLFFGQEATIRRVLEKLQKDRAALIWGPSGTGKSSLATAGIAARMDSSLFLDTDGWTAHVIRPSQPGVLRLTDGAPSGKRRQIADVVIVDQLEEISDLKAEAQAQFCEALIALTTGSSRVVIGNGHVLGPEHLVRVVATVRDDLEWKLDRDIPALRPLLERRIIARGVDANFAHSIVVEPAMAAGFEVENADRVKKEVEERLTADPASLPIVQFALSEWWRNRSEEKKVLPYAAWKEFGGVDGALSFVAEKLYTDLDEQKQQRLQTIMLRFFRDGRKQPVLEKEIVDPADLELINKLREVWLIQLRDVKGMDRSFEVEHDSLATHWKRLAEWLAARKSDDEFIADLEARAALWRRDGRRDARLPTEKLELASTLSVRLSDDAREFVDAAGEGAKRRLVRRTLLTLGVMLSVGLFVAGAVWISNASLEKLADDYKRQKEELTKLETERERAQKDLDESRVQAMNAGAQAEAARVENEKRQKENAELVRAKDAQESAFQKLKAANAKCRKLIDLGGAPPPL